MKYAFLFFFLLFSVKGAFAECGFAGISVFPAADTIKQNPVFVLGGGFGSDEIIRQLESRCYVYLRSKSDIVKLQLKEILVGEFFEVQAVLVPKKKLKVGEKYELQIDFIPGDTEVYKVGKYGQSSNKPIEYIVAAGKDIAPPVVSGMPHEVGKTLYHFGCGPEIYVKFTHIATDAAEMMVRATVKSLQSGRATSFYIPLVKGKIWVGRDMCGGAFAFQEGLDYEVSFAYMDAYGNQTFCKGDPVKFTIPTVESPPNWRREGNVLVELEEEPDH